MKQEAGAAFCPTCRARCCASGCKHFPDCEAGLLRVQSGRADKKEVGDSIGRRGRLNFSQMFHDMEREEEMVDSTNEDSMTAKQGKDISLREKNKEKKAKEEVFFINNYILLFNKPKRIFIIFCLQTEQIAIQTLTFSKRTLTIY
jgi:hypothetical protein